MVKKKTKQKPVPTKTESGDSSDAVPEKIASVVYGWRNFRVWLGQSVRSHFMTALGMSFFLFWILGALLALKYLGMLPISDQIWRTSGIPDAAVAKAPPSEVFIVEEDWFYILDVSMTADIITLDNLYWTKEEKEEFDKKAKRFPDAKPELDAIKRGFGIKWIKEQERYRTNASYDRFLDVLNQPPAPASAEQSKLDRMLNIEARKEVFMDDRYWQWRKNGVMMPVFGDEPQEAMVVLKILGAKGQGILHTGSDQSRFAQDLRKYTGRESIVIPVEERTLTVFMHKTEIIHFESDDYNWTVTLTRVSNPGKWREAKDIVSVKWSVREKSTR